MNPRRSLALFVVLFVGVLAGRAYAARRKQPHGGTPLRCTLRVSPAGPQRSLSLVVRNEGRVPVELRYYYPVMPARVTATIAGARVTLHEPAIDMPVRPERRTLAPGAELTLPSVIRVRFAPPAGAPRDDDPFLWTIEHAPARVELEGLFGEEPHWVPCRGVLEP